MSIKKTPALSRILYVFAGIAAVYSIWAFVQCTVEAVRMLDAEGLEGAEDLFLLINFYVLNSVQFMFYAVILFALGKLLCTRLSAPAAAGRPAKVSVPAAAKPTADEPVSTENTGGEVDADKFFE